MNEYRLYKFEKENPETKFLLFVSKALAKTERNSSRPWLQMLHCDGTRIVGTDGHRLHTYTPDECFLPKGLFTVEKKSKTLIYLSSLDSELSLIENYPDIDRVIPSKNNPVTFSGAGLNARLAEMLRAIDAGCVNIDFFNDAISLPHINEYQVTDHLSPLAMFGDNVQVVLMPMRS